MVVPRPSLPLPKMWPEQTLSVDGLQFVKHVPIVSEDLIVVWDISLVRSVSTMGSGR
jgi:hypothetical protein